MITLVSNSPLELRGVSSRVSAKGKPYHIINVEESDGTPLQLYAPEDAELPQSVKKGEQYRFYFDVYRFGSNERLVVRKMELKR